MAAHAILISHLRSCNISGFDMQTAFFRAPHKKKSYGVRSGGLGGYSTF
jgi:hypothetical protein